MTERAQRVEAYRQRLAEQAERRGAPLGPGLAPIVEQFFQAHAEEMVKIEEQRGTVGQFEEVEQVGALLLLLRLASGLETCGIGRGDPRQRILTTYLELMLGLEFDPRPHG